MAQKLFMYLHAQPDHSPDWSVMDEMSVIFPSVKGDNQDTLSDLAKDRQVIVFVPAQDVLLTSVKLPRIHRSRLSEVLPFALEEQVIGEVETLHFVAGEKQSDGSCPIAIVSREKMQTWLAQLQALQVQPDIFIPLTMSLPVEENTWMITCHDMTIVRMNSYQGFACENNNAEKLLEFALQGAEVIPQRIQINNYTQNTLARSLPETMEVKEDFRDPAQLLPDLASAALKFPYINLLQGTYKPRKSRFPEVHKIWKIASTLSVVWLVLVVLTPALSYFMLKHQENNINGQIAEIYQRHFPDASNVVAPRLRLQEKLQTLNTQGGGNKCLLLIGYAGKAMHEASGITVKRLDFNRDQLILELTAVSAEDFSRLTNALSREGLTVKQDSADLLGSSVHAVITVG